MVSRILKDNGVEQEFTSEGRKNVPEDHLPAAQELAGILNGLFAEGLMEKGPHRGGQGATELFRAVHPNRLLR